MSRVLKSEQAKFVIMSSGIKETRIKQALDAAQKLYSAKEYQESDRLVQDVLQDNPDNNEALELQQKLKVCFRQRSESQEKRQQEKEKQDRLVRQLLHYVNEQCAEGNYESAVFLLSYVTLQDARLTEKKIILEKQILQKEKEKRQEEREKAELARSVGDLYYRAEEEHKKGHYAASLSLLKEIIETDIDISERRKARILRPLLQILADSWARGQLKKANLAWKRKRNHEAYLLYLDVLTVLPNNKNALRRRGQLVRKLLKASKLHYERGVVFLGMNMIQKAKHEFQLAVNLSPNTTNRFYEQAARKLQEIHE